MKQSKTAKRILTVLLTLLLVTSALPLGGLTAFAEDETHTSGDFRYIILEDGSAEITNYWGSAKTLEIPSKLDAYTVTSIGDSAFAWCNSLTSVSIPNSVTSIGKYAFAYSDNIKSVMIPDSVTSIGENAFYWIENLTSITVDSNNKNYSSQDDILFNIDKTELIKYSIGNKRTSYTIPDTVSIIDDYAFAMNKKLTSIAIPDSVTSIGDFAFAYCYGLTNITISERVTSIGVKALSRCDNLISITVDANNKSYSSQDGVLFNKYKTELIQYPIGNARSSYTIPDNVTSIDDEAFAQCDSLTNVTIGNDVTSIGKYAFAMNKKLTSLTIPDSVTSIGAFAFSDCYNLTDVYYGGSKEQWSEINIGKYNDGLEIATIHYTSSGSDIPGTSFKELYFESPVAVMDVGETCQLVVHSRDVSYVNGEPVYSNDRIVDNSEIVWDGYYESNGIIKMSDSGQVTALKEGIEYVLVHSKDDISQGTSCRVFVGNPNEFGYTATYDTKQYYAEGGFYSEVSSVSDCVEIYMMLENKLADALKDLTSVSGDPYGEEARAKFKNIAPITLTAKVSGNDLSFSRDSYTNTYTAKFDELSVGKSVDDVLMLFPRNININPNGNTYTVTVTLKSDSFETITEQYTFTVEDLETKNANEHIAFAYGNPDYRVSKKNNYGESMRSLKDDWEYNLSRILSMDFENYYEIAFSDILIQMMNVDQLGNISLLPVVKEWVGNYKTILSGVSTIVEDNYTGYLDVTENAIDKLLKKSKYTTDGMDVDDELRDFVVLKLKDKVSIDKVNSMFAAVDKTQQYYSYFKLSENITNDIADFIDGVSVLNSFQGMNDAFKDVIKQLYNKIPESENTLRDAVYHFVNLENSGGYTEEVLQDVALLAKNITEDAFKTMFKKQYISLICKYIGSIPLKSGALLSSTATFSAISTGLGAVATGASLGVCLSDFLCDNSGKAEEMSKIVAMSEFSPYVIDTLNEYESKLYADRNDKAVDSFEYAFALHKATQSYIMEHTVKALETKRDSIIIKLFGRDDYDGLISDILAQKSVIDNLKCHNPNGESTVVTKTKVVAIKCPVDVFVYDESGQEVVRIKNDVAEYIADGINYFIEAGEKYLALPADQTYSIKIIATDDGHMDYVVTEYSDGGNGLKTVRKTNIELLDGRVFTGNITEEMDAEPENYALQYDGNVLLPDASDVQLGDINGDKTVDAIDARWVLQASTNSRELTVEQQAAADVNADGVIDAIDARWILQASTGSRTL